MAVLLVQVPPPLDKERVQCAGSTLPVTLRLIDGAGHVANAINTVTVAGIRVAFTY